MSELARFIAARDCLLAARTDYATAHREFAWPVLAHFNWGRDYFDSMAEGNEQPGLWLVHEDGSQDKLSFEQLSRRSNQVANFLLARGVQAGDPVLLMLGNVVPLWEIMLAAIKLGVIVIPATSMLTGADLQDRLDRGGVRHVVTDASQVGKFADRLGTFSRIVIGADQPGWQRYENYQSMSEQLSEAQIMRDVHAPLLRYFTSGTTSKPKLVDHSQISYPVGHLSTMYWIGSKPGDVHWNISSPGWAKHAYSCFFAPWNAGACVFVLNQTRFDPKRTLAALSNYGIHTLCAPPTVWRMLIQEDLEAVRPTRLREVVAAGEPLNPEVIEQVRRAWQLVVRDGYGQTETTVLVANTPGQPVKPGSVGRPLPGWPVALIDADGKHGTLGEIAIELATRPPGLMTAYAGDSDKTANALGGAHYRTGDVASSDADGYITFIGRSDDIFKSSDYRISPFELESVLIEHPDIAEAAVVPSPCPRRLSVPKAFLLLRSGADPSPERARAILEFCRERLAPYKRVRRLEFMDLPKTISGKIRRVELRALELSRDLSQRRPTEFWEEDDFVIERNPREH